MIFPNINSITIDIISKIKTSKNNTDDNILKDFKTIIDFFQISRDYIESRDSYPKNIDDNPILKCEYENYKIHNG